MTTESIFLLTELGTEITNMAAWVIVLSDLSLNLYLTIRIIWMKNMEDFHTKIKKPESLLVSLLLNEIVDAVVPLTYGIYLLLSYHGPNAELIHYRRNRTSAKEPSTITIQIIDHVAFWVRFTRYYSLFKRSISTITKWTKMAFFLPKYYEFDSDINYHSIISLLD